MRASEVRFPPTIGDVVRGIRSEVAVRLWTDVTVQPKLPKTKTRRMVTVRDDGGTGRNGVLPRRFGVNVWAESPVLAEALALDVVSGLRVRLKFIDVTEPVEVLDEADEALTVSGKTLTHYYIAGTQVVRAVND